MNELARGNPEMHNQEPKHPVMDDQNWRRITKTLMTSLNAVLRLSNDNYLASLLVCSKVS